MAARELFATVELSSGVTLRLSSVIEVTASKVDRTLRDGEHFPDGFTVPAGQVWEFPADHSATVTTAGSVVVLGTLRMRPSSPDVDHLLQFVGIDESKFVGGGHMVLPGDVGMWITGEGQWDAAAHPRERWNRTGKSRTWLPGDEAMVAPNKPGDYTFRRFTPGGVVPFSVAPDRVALPTETFNLTSNVRVEGTPGKRAHIFIRSTKPQHISHVAVRWLGPRVPAAVGTTAVLGRYPIHFHHAGEGSRGTTIEGVVVRDSSRAFVPHGSSGITLRDCVAYNITDDAYWWDEEHPTDDTNWDHCAAFAVTNDPNYRGLITGFLFGIGKGNRARDCVSAVVRGNLTANGFHWPEFANLHADNVWDEATGLVSHNNPGHGVYVWQNDKNPHHIDHVTSYSNGGAGLVHGAYVNHYAYRDVRCWDNKLGDLKHQAAARRDSGKAQGWDDVLAPVLVIAEHAKIATIDNSHPTTIRNLRCRQIIIDEKVSLPTNPFGSGAYELHCAPGWELRPENVTVRYQVSIVTVHNADGSTFTVRP